MSLALTQEKGLLPLAVGEGFPLQKLFTLFHLQDFPPGPLSLSCFTLPSSPWRRDASAAEEAPEQL